MNRRTINQQMENYLSVIQGQSNHDAFLAVYSRRLLILVLQGKLIPPGEPVILPLDVETSFKSFKEWAGKYLECQSF